MTDKPTLYSLARDAAELYEGIMLEMDENGELPADSMALSNLHIAEGALAEKAERCAFVLERLGNEAATLREYAESFRAKAKAMENAEARLKDYIKEGLELAGMDKVKAGPWTLALQRNPPSVDVQDEEAVPAEFKTVEMVLTLDRKRLLDALKEGATVPGARLVTDRKHLRVRPK